MGETKESEEIPSLTKKENKQADAIAQLFLNRADTEALALKDSVPNAVWNAPQVQEAAKINIINMAAWTDNASHYTQPIMDSFGWAGADIVSSPAVQKIAKESILLGLDHHHVSRVFVFPWTDEFIKDEEIQSKVKLVVTYIAAQCDRGYGDSIIYKSIDSDIKKISEYVRVFRIEPDFFEQIKPDIQDRLRYAIKIYAVDSISLILEKFPGHLYSEVKDDAIKEIMRALVFNKNEKDKVIQMMNILGLNVTPLDFYNDTRFARDRKNVDEIDSLVPGFKDRIMRSIDMYCNFIGLNEKDIKDIKENLYLIDAFEANPKMGLKLMASFHAFDEQSRENVKTLFYFSREVVQENPGIQPRSAEFRKKVQEKLKGYKRNTEILDAMEAKGANVDAWLNHDEERVVFIGGNEGSFSERSVGAVENMRIALVSIKEHTVASLTEFKGVLVKSEIILLDVLSIEEEIVRVQREIESAEASGDTRKADGLRIAIGNLEKQEQNPKKIKAWEKITKDLEVINRLFKKLLQLMESIKDLEVQIAAGDKPEEYRYIAIELQEKTRIVQANVISLGQRMQDININIKETLISALGKDDGAMAFSQFESGVAECVGDFESNCRALQAVSDAENKGLGKIKVRIRLWDRDPNIDLYLGNYSDCCVRIDSQHSKTESVIADYVTDLGMQVIVVDDEKTGEPFAAGWCFLSDDLNGNKTLTFCIDNAEMEGSYAPYRKEIGVEVGEYVRRYATAVGVKQENIVQGTSNNDFVAVDPKNVRDRQNKIGRFNREYAYYLESL